MSTPVIIDSIVVAILAVFTLCGLKRGLFRALAGLVIVVVALVGAGMIANAAAAPAARLVAPLIQQHIELKVDDALTVQASQPGWGQMPEAEVDQGFQIEDLLGIMGLDREMTRSLSEKALDIVRDTGVSIAAAVVESLAQSVIYGVLFLLSFLALTVVLNLAARALDLVLKLPGLHGLNALGGGLVGVLEGALLLFLAVWAARRLGVSFETETLAATHVLRFFTTHTPLSALSFLQ